MSTLQIEKSDALKVFEAGDAKTKKALEKLFGAETFAPKITDRVKTYEDACKIEAPKSKLPYPQPKNIEEEVMNTIFKARHIAKVLKGDWQADWKNKDQKKWFPVFVASGAGFNIILINH